MDTTNQWTQQECSSRAAAAVGIMERKVMSRPQKDQALNCPRCHSTNTKFCYYNNYSLTQPRYFCKTCRRYWTEGGTLRNVPVGGGSRKNKIRSSPSSTSTHKINIPADDHHHLINIPTTTNLPHHDQFPSRNPYYYYKILHESAAGQDLNLGFPSSYLQDYHHHHHDRPSSSSSTPPPLPPPSFAALEILKTTTGGGGGADLNNSFVIPTGTSTPAPAAGFSFHDLMKPTTVSFSRYGDTADEQMIQENGTGRLMFPFGGAMKQVSGGGSTTTEADQSSNGYNWNGMLGRSGPW